MNEFIENVYLPMVKLHLRPSTYIAFEELSKGRVPPGAYGRIPRRPESDAGRNPSKDGPQEEIPGRHVHR